MAERSLRYRRTRRGIVVLIVGTVLGIVFVAGLVVSAGSALKSGLSEPSHQVPASLTLDLDAGAYRLYEETGSRSQTGPVTYGQFNAADLDASALHVTGPGEVDVTVQAMQGGVSETLTRGSAVYSAVARFRTPTAGRYVVRIDGRTTHRVIVARSVGDSFGAVLPWLLVGFPAGIVFLLGIVLLIVGLATTNPGAHDASSYAGRAPPGWYPDAQGTMRYFDGRSWTDQVAPPNR